MSEEENVVYQCPKKTRIPERKGWYVRSGETEREATFCGICRSEGCAGVPKDQLRVVECKGANCDCPNPEKHWAWNLKLEPVWCEACATKKRGNLKTCSLFRCENCHFNQIDSELKFCDYCSDKLCRCYECGAPESRWQRLVRIYHVGAQLKYKFLAQQLTEADLANYSNSGRRNILAYQEGCEEALEWE